MWVNIPSFSKQHWGFISSSALSQLQAACHGKAYLVLAKSPTAKGQQGDYSVSTTVILSFPQISLPFWRLQEQQGFSTSPVAGWHFIIPRGLSNSIFNKYKQAAFSIKLLLAGSWTVTKPWQCRKDIVLTVHYFLLHLARYFFLFFFFKQSLRKCVMQRNVI